MFQVAVWFDTLFPDVSYPSSRLSGVLDRLVKKTQGLLSGGGDMEAFLRTELDFDFVSFSLSKIGLKRGHLLKEHEWTQSPNFETLVHETVIDIELFRIKEKQPEAFTCNWIKTLSNQLSTASDALLKKSVKKLMEAYRTLSKNAKQEEEKLNLFLSMPFTTVDKQPTLHLTGNCATTPLTPEQKDLKKLSKSNAVLHEQKGELKLEVSVLKEALQDVSTDKTRLTSELEAKVDELTRLQGSIDRLERENKTQKNEIRRLNPYRVNKLRNTLEKTRKDLRSVENSLAATETMLKEERNNLQRARVQASKLKATVTKQERENAELKQQVQDLIHELHLVDAEGSVPRPQLRASKNRFSDRVRQTVITLQGDGNVPATKCNFVIRTVADQLFGIHFEEKDLPCTSSSLNIADEGHVLSKFQATEKMLATQNCTIHTDGTSRGGKKFLGFQVSLDTGETLSLGYQSVATEDSATLLDVTITLLEEIHQLYSLDMSPQEQDEIFRELLSKITSTMTDRAAVMKAFDKKLEDYLKTTLGQDAKVHFLHCNAHCLLGFSRACEQALCAVEADITGKLGRDKDPRFARFNKAESAAARLIRTASDICGPRGDDKNGCRAEWLAYCHENGRKSLLTSYRSNRFNCFFQGAAAILFHREDLQSFLTNGYLGRVNLKIDSVKADIVDEKLLSLVCAVALLYLQVTGPYWQLLESSVKHAEFHVYVQMMEACFDRWRDDPSDLLNIDYRGIFNGEFEMNSPTLPTVCKFAAENLEAVKDAVSRMLRDMLVTTRAQLKDFLCDGQYGTVPSPEVAETLKHCPVTNLIGENAFGDLDFDINKRRHTTLHHRSSTQMWRANKTRKWLSRKGVQEQTNLMALARKQGKLLRKRHQQQEKIVMLKVREAIIDNERRKREKEARDAQKQLVLIRAVFDHGGPCESKEDVQKLKTKLRSAGKKPTAIKEAIKNEIRYQKTIRKQKNLTLSGTLADLMRMLSEHLPQQCQHNVSSTGCDTEPEGLPPLQTQHEDGEPQPKRRRGNTDGDSTADQAQDATDDQPFEFHAQGQWVAVFFSEQFYIGQVIEVLNPQQARVQYLFQSNARKDCFKWPPVDDVAITEAYYVFQWDFEVLPTNRTWTVPAIEEIQQQYDSIKQR